MCYRQTMPDQAPLAEHDEATALRHRRIAREARLLAEARADIAAGMVVDEAAVNAWIDSIGTEGELSPPFPIG